MSNIYLYTDYVFNNDVLRQRLADAVPDAVINLCDADAILSGALDDSIDLLVMPGGADLYLCEKLNGAGNTKIRDYVMQGGNFLGICSGSYYACHSLEFASHLPKEEISGARELSLHQGKATGPILEYIPQADLSRGLDGVANLSYNDQSFSCLYRGGPIYEEGYDETILARYQDLDGQPAAIIETIVGQGKAILCSPHLEQRSSDFQKMIYQHRNKEHAYMTELAKALEPHNENIEQAWTSLVQRALTSKGTAS